MSLLKEVWLHMVPYAVSAPFLAASPASLGQSRDTLTLPLLQASLGNSNI